MRIYVDDQRRAPEGWHLCQTINDAIRAIAMYGEQIEEISLDHDIGHEKMCEDMVYRSYSCDETFEAVAWYIKSYYGFKNDVNHNMMPSPFKIPKITIHTANPAARERMRAILDGFEIEIRPANVDKPLDK